MSWFVKSPFKRNEDPVGHMVELLSNEASKAGTPLTDLDKEILANNEPIPEDLEKRARELIARIFEAEPLEEFERDPKCFSSSLQWAGDLGYANIVGLAEQVAYETARSAQPQGWKLVKDKAQLIGCGLLVVLFMFAVVIAAGFLFGWK
jgi:hypothetical protein